MVEKIPTIVYDIDSKELTLLSFTIPLVPISKKNSSQIFYNKASGRRIVAPSKAYRDYENQAGYLSPKTYSSPLQSM